MNNLDIFNSVSFFIFTKTFNLKSNYNFFKIYFDGAKEYTLVPEDDFIKIMIKLAGLNYFYEVYKKDNSTYFFDIKLNQLKQLRLEADVLESVKETELEKRKEYLQEKQVKNLKANQKNLALGNDIAEKYFDSDKIIII